MLAFRRYPSLNGRTVAYLPSLYITLICMHPPCFLFPYCQNLTTETRRTSSGKDLPLSFKNFICSSVSLCPQWFHVIPLFFIKLLTSPFVPFLLRIRNLLKKNTL